MNKVIKQLRLLLAASVGVPVLLALLFELDILPSGTLTYMAQTEFLCAIIMELLTIILIPTALRLFKTKNVGEDDVKALRTWGVVRIMMITAPLLLNTLGYYLFMNTTFGYMALILLICTPFIYIGDKK